MKIQVNKNKFDYVLFYSNHIIKYDCQDVKRNDYSPS